jgi:hypothetical protein
MTTHQRYARALTITAVLLSASTITAAVHRQPLPAAALAYGAALFVWGARREYAAHRRVLEEHEWARRAALGQQPPPLDPCCALYRHSGTVHAPNCTLVFFEQLIAAAYDDTRDSA